MRNAERFGELGAIETLDLGEEQGHPLACRNLAQCPLQVAMEASIEHEILG